MAKAQYRLKNIGRSKWSGVITVNNADVQERVEAALIREARKHLISNDVDLAGDFNAGHIIAGGFRPVGEYEKVQHG